MEKQGMQQTGNVVVSARPNDRSILILHLLQYRPSIAPKTACCVATQGSDREFVPPLSTPIPIAVQIREEASVASALAL